MSCPCAKRARTADDDDEEDAQLSTQEKTNTNMPQWLPNLEVETITTRRIASGSTDSATSTTAGPNTFRGGIAVDGFSMIRQAQFTRPVLKTVPNLDIVRNAAVSTWNTSALVIDSATAVDPTTYANLLNPSNGCVVRTGITGTVTDVGSGSAAYGAWPTALIANIEADLGKTWDVYTYYPLTFINSTTAASSWVLQIAWFSSGPIILKTAVSSFTITSSVNNFGNILMSRIMRLPGNRILIYTL